MKTYWKTGLAVALCTAAWTQPGRAQVAPPSILQIDLTDHILYFEDIADPARFATEPNVIATGVGSAVRNFPRSTGIADIVAINGQRVTGT